MMSKGKARKMLAAAALLLLAASMGGAQNDAQGDPLVQKMVTLVVAHNPILLSQQRLVAEAQRIPDRAAGFSISGMNLGGGAYTLNPYTGAPGFLPSLTLGLTFSFSDPARELNILKMKQEKELARQAWETARDAALASLFSRVREILRLKSQGKNLQVLRGYLHDYSVLADTQRSEQAISPDKLWDLRQRISDIDTQLDTLDGQLETTMMEAALNLGGDAWPELLALLHQLGT
jgi:hypothetical protein